MTLTRKRWTPDPQKASNLVDHLTLCAECGLQKREHINGYFCPEWRLRQMDGDR